MPVKDVVMKAYEDDRDPRNTDARVDELGRLLEEEAAGDWKKKQKRIAELKQTMCAEVMAGPTKPDVEVPIEGDEFLMVVDGAGEVREVREVVEIEIDGKKVKVHGLRAIHEMLGDEMFYRAAGITMKNIDAYLTIDQRDKVVAKRGASTRTMKSCTRRA